MNNIEKKLLNVFGEHLITCARDKTINESIKTIKGEIKDDASMQIAEKLKGLDAQKREALEDLIIDSIDGALNNFLWMLERENIFDLILHENSMVISLKEISDGLSVDYWSFVDKFSKYKRLDP